MDNRILNSALRWLVIIIFTSALCLLGHSVLHLKDQARFLLILPVLTAFMVLAIYLLRDNQ